MARKRMIDPNFWTSQDVGKLSDRARLLLIGLFSLADDHGKGNGNLTYLRSQIFCYSEITVKQVEKLISEIAETINIEFYKVGPNEYYRFTNWSKWQYINRPSASGIPDPVIIDGVSTESKPKAHGGFSEDSVSTHGMINEDSRLIEKNKNRKENNKNLNPLTPLKGGTDSQPKTETKPDWNTTLLQIFQEEFQASRGFPYPLTTYKGKEAKEINDVYQKYLQMKTSMGVVPNTQQALEEMRTFIKIGMRINDKWIFDNMSPGVLSMKFSTIATMMKENRNGSYQRPNISDADINQIADLTGLR